MMKKLLFFIVFLFAVAVQAQDKKSTKNPQIVEVSCGECQFGLKGKSCDLAVRIDGKAYFADGTKIDDHGDAHAKDGFCEAIRKAEVTGKIVNNRFQVTSFILLPEQK
jgi:hypothetical protein